MYIPKTLPKKEKLATYDPDDLETVYIFDTDYNYICSVSAKLKTPFRNCVVATYSAEIEKTLENSKQEKEHNRSIMDEIMFNYYQKNA